MTNFMMKHNRFPERYIQAPMIDAYINSTGFFYHSLTELHKSRESYEEMKESLLKYVNDKKFSKEFENKIHAIPHTPSSQQKYPLEAHSDISNTPKLDLLSLIEKSPKTTVLPYPS